MKIYVAGPYTKGDVVHNVRYAVQNADYITSVLGHVAFCPHLTHLWHMIEPHSIEFWYKYDIEWLKSCDAILRLPGESTGADNEVKIAKELGLKIFFNLSDIPKKER